jgi:hypothetical protein
VAEGQILFNAVLVSGMHAGGSTQTAAALGAFGLTEMPPARAGAQDLATGGNLESLGGGFLRFDAFWTSHNESAFFEKSAQYRKL